MNDAEHTGCLSTSTGNKELEEAAVMFLSDRTVPITKNCTKLRLAKGVYTIVYDSLGFHKACASKRQRSIITLIWTSTLVTWNIIIMKNFNCIITGDETWIYHIFSNLIRTLFTVLEG